MTLSLPDIDVRDRARFRTVTAFLENRLAEQETVDWALRLGPDSQIERAAISELLVTSGAPRLRDPYATAWPLILESWTRPVTGDFPVAALQRIRERLQGGERSGSLADTIAGFVAPRLEVKPLQARPVPPARRSRRPKKVGDLLSASLTSIFLAVSYGGHRLDLGLEETGDAAFLRAVASALTSAVDRGLYLACRIYGTAEDEWPPMASPLRVYFVPPRRVAHDRDGSGGPSFEPDAAFGGVGPAVKVLHAVLQRIVELDAGMARSIVAGWRHSDMAVYRRLWAAVARNPDAVSAAEVGEFLTRLDESDFWNYPCFPEFAELRAVRFGGLEPETQGLILGRLRKGLPRRIFPRKVAPDKIRALGRITSAMELRRIEVGGGILPTRDRDWLIEMADELPGLRNMAIHTGFRDPWNLPRFPPGTSLESRFGDMEGEARLQALEDALSGDRSADEASNWLGQSDHASEILTDLEGAAVPVNRFPRLWDSFGRIHSPPTAESSRDAGSEAARVLALMNRLSDATVEAAIEGVCLWLWMWSAHVIGSEPGRQVWLRAWPLAVKVSNATETEEGTGGKLRMPGEIDAFHLPVGKLLRVFREAFRDGEEFPDPFTNGGLFARMRECAIAAPGRSGLIAHCHLVQELSAFLQSDPAWARRHLVEPLLTDDDRSVLLWRAVASAWIDPDALKLVGEEAAKRVLDDRLDRDARKGLVFRLVHEGLGALADRREPFVPPARISQMLRAADDELRAWAAFEIWQFQDCARRGAKESRPPRTTFSSAVKPFLEHVWPQERSLATVGVSRQLSCLPAVSGEAFPEAVDVVERFLIPFDSESMLSYGFSERDISGQLGMPRLSDAVDDASKAGAFLRLLDLTVGESSDAAVPGDLSAALHQIESQDSRLASEPAFRRLAAAARR